MPLTTLTSPRHQTTKINLFHVRFHTKATALFQSGQRCNFAAADAAAAALWPLAFDLWLLASSNINIVNSSLWALAPGVSGLGMGVYPCRSRSTLCVGRGSIHDRPWIDTGTSRSTLVNNGLTSIEPLKNCMPSQLCIELWFWLWLWLVARTYYSADDLCEHRFADPERVPTIQSYQILVGG